MCDIGNFLSSMSLNEWVSFQLDIQRRLLKSYRKDPFQYNDPTMLNSKAEVKNLEQMFVMKGNTGMRP